MSHSQFHCTGRVYLDLHGLIFETSICYWQDQPGSPWDTRAGPSRPRVLGTVRAVCGRPPGAPNLCSWGVRCAPAAKSASAGARCGAWRSMGARCLAMAIHCQSTGFEKQSVFRRLSSAGRAGRFVP